MWLSPNSLMLQFSIKAGNERTHTQSIAEYILMEQSEAREGKGLLLWLFLPLNLKQEMEKKYFNSNSLHAFTETLQIYFQADIYRIALLKDKLKAAD